jgi:hypothetical protein
MKDESKRIIAFRRFLKGEATLEDLRLLSQQQNAPLKRSPKEEIKDWGRYCGKIRGEERTYLAPRDGIWASGRSIKVEEAYQLVNEDEKDVYLRQVQDSEIRDVEEICRQHIKRLLNEK